ncbi:hypothetical protein LTR17_007509 [Elasticomyces elasticus]|nr:hypothetical protein LTR17_007509 [Elasticomyces elasticus]
MPGKPGRGRQRRPADKTAVLGDIPVKYLQPGRLPIPANEFEYNSMTIAVTAQPTAISPTSRPHGTLDSKSGPHAKCINAGTNPATLRNDELPELPAWVVGVLAGMLSFGLILSVVLYLANFPPDWEWLYDIRMRLMRRRRDGYAKINEQAEGDESEERGRPKQSGSAGLGISFASATATGGLASRRRKNLSVDTSGRYGGPGVAVLDKDKDRIDGYDVESRDQSTLYKRERRTSYDEETLRYRQPPVLSPARFAWEALTAPIPSIESFTGFAGRGASSAKTPISRNGVPHRRWESANTHHGSTTAPLGISVELGQVIAEHKSVNIFHRIGEGVEHAAEKLGKVLSNAVDGDAEEGLLLPVQMSERERGYEPGLRTVKVIFETALELPVLARSTIMGLPQAQEPTATSSVDDTAPKSASQLPPEALALATKLFDFSRQGKTAELRQYVTAGIPVNLTNHKGDTLLMLGAYHGHLETVSMLLELQADVNVLNERGQSPIAGAVFKGYPEIVKALVDGGADIYGGQPNAVDSARMFRRDDILEVLGVDVRDEE